MSDNRSQLVGVAVQGSIASPQCPALPASPYIIGADGSAVLLPPPAGFGTPSPPIEVRHEAAGACPAR